MEFKIYLRETGQGMDFQIDRGERNRRAGARFCATITAESRKDAIRKLKRALVDAVVALVNTAQAGGER